MSEFRICIRNKKTGERREVTQPAISHWVAEITVDLKENEVIQSISVNDDRSKENAMGYACSGQSGLMFAVLAVVILVVGWLVLEPMFSNMLAVSGDALKTACEAGVTNCIH